MSSSYAYPYRSRPLQHQFLQTPQPVKKRGRHEMEVIYEDNHLLVIDKPAGLTTQGAYQESSVYEQAKAYLKQKYAKPGNVYLGIVSRLDKRVSGVLVLARTSKAASRLSKQFREVSPKKEYLAIVEGRVDTTSEPVELTNWLNKSEREQRMLVFDRSVPKALESRLRFRYVDSNGRNSLLRVELLTGRKHQIRAQLAHAGLPIIGDEKYGSREAFPQGIALHARRITIEHPTQKTSLSFEAPVPSSWSRFGFPPRSLD